MTSRQEASLERSKEKLKRDIEKSVLKSTDEILNIAEVAIADPQRYKTFRGKVLRAANDAIRDVKKNLDLHFTVSYIPLTEDIVEIQRPRTN